jgi:hypothetical protein
MEDCAKTNKLDLDFFNNILLDLVNPESKLPELLKDPTNFGCKDVTETLRTISGDTTNKLQSILEGTQYGAVPIQLYNGTEANDKEDTSYVESYINSFLKICNLPPSGRDKGVNTTLMKVLSLMVSDSGLLKHYFDKYYRIRHPEYDVTDFQYWKTKLGYAC